jgi:membrane associated rhomboid family serine protease
MIAVLPLRLEHGLIDVRRSTPVVWTMVVIISLLFVVERVVAWDLAHAGQRLPLVAVHMITFVSASWSSYVDSALFQPWQLWSSTLIQPTWCHWLGDVVMLWLCGRALERQLGSWSFLLICAIITPLTTALAVLWSVAPIIQGTHGLLAALGGYALVRFRHAPVVFGLWYWAVVFVGEIRLFSLSFTMVLLGYVLWVLFLARPDSVAASAWWIVCCFAVGGLLAWQVQARQMTK